MHVIIIGAGIGGLACGIRLAAQGYEVTILEKNQTPGGRCSRHESQGFVFDTGPTLMMMPNNLDRLFEDVGRKRSEELPLERLDPAYRINFSDGQTLDFTQKLKDLEHEIRKFGPDEMGNFHRFISQGEQFYREIFEAFIDRPLEHPSRYVTGQALSLLVRTKPWNSVFQVAKKFFRSPHLQIAFSFQTIYLGMSPEEAPGIYSMLSYIDLVDGVYYPRGGMSKIPEILTRLFQELGGKLEVGVEVERILSEGGKATGVLLHNEKTLLADAVVSNVDLPTTYTRFLQTESRSQASRRVSRMKKGCSSAVFLWGVEKSYPELRHHNLYLPVHFREAMGDLFRERKIPEDPAFYLCTPSRTDAAMAPPGCESLMVLVPVPNLEEPRDWAAIMPVLRQRVLSRLERTLTPGLSRRIVTERTLSPAWYESRYALESASTFGLLPSFFQSAMFRPQRRSPDLKGLYFAGAGVHPGNGIPIVLISGRLAAEAITEDFGRVTHVSGHRSAVSPPISLP